jgi:hypothetical protein
MAAGGCEPAEEERHGETAEDGDGIASRGKMGVPGTMRRAWRDALLPLAAIVSVASLTACGGSSGSSTASTPAPSAPPTVTTTTSSPTAAAKPAGKARRASPPAGSGPSGSGGAAASFRVPHTDNSIPDFGREAPASEHERATAALAAYLHARANGEWSSACSYLAGATRGQLERLVANSKAGSEGCGPVLAALSRGPAAARADPLTGGVVALRVSGNRAFALFHGPNNSKYVMPMVNEGGAWKVSQLAPLAYPLGPG